MLRRLHPCQEAPDLVAGSALPGTDEEAFAVSRGDGLPGRPRGRHGGAADRMMTATSDRRLTEDYLPVDWREAWNAEVSGAP